MIYLAVHGLTPVVSLGVASGLGLALLGLGVTVQAVILRKNMVNQIRSQRRKNVDVFGFWRRP